MPSWVGTAATLCLAAWLGCAVVRAETAPDMSAVPADLELPEMSEGAPGPGKRVRLALFANTPPVVLYLPGDWTPERRFPVMIELAGNGNYRNAFGDVSTGRPEDSRLGYGLSGGRGWVWACLPFLVLLGVALLVITRWPALATAPLGA